MKCLGYIAALVAIFVSAGLSSPSWAGTAEARETARLNNCPPKKIEVYRQTMGEVGETVYRIECNLPKMTDATLKGPQASALLVSCVNALCHAMRPLKAETK
ncbi:MAG: hypothetical protein ABTQ34_07140 [Bdellovibrionales bacterium]